MEMAFLIVAGIAAFYLVVNLGVAAVFLRDPIDH
jgi:hypothetical protein